MSYIYNFLGDKSVFALAGQRVNSSMDKEFCLCHSCVCPFLLVSILLSTLDRSVYKKGTESENTVMCMAFVVSVSCVNNVLITAYKGDIRFDMGVRNHTGSTL